MLQNAYFLAKIGADTAENEQHFAEIFQIFATTLRVHASVVHRAVRHRAAHHRTEDPLGGLLDGRAASVAVISSSIAPTWRIDKI